MKKKEKNIFIVTIAFMLVALALMVTFNFLSFYKNAVNNMETVGSSSLSAEISEIQAYISQATNTLSVTADNIDYMMNQDITPDEIEQYLKFETTRFQEEIDENFTGVYGYINGQYIDGSDWIPPSDYVPTERDWYTAAAQSNGDPVIVTPYVDAMTNEVITSVCCLLDDGKSVISIDIVLNRVQEITESINLDNMGYAFIVDESGLIIAHNDSSEVGKNCFGNYEMLELIEEAKTSEYFNRKLDGEDIYVFTGEATAGWRVVMIIPKSAFLKSSQDLLIKNILIVIVVYAAVIFFSVFAFRKLKESIEELDKKQQQVENANKNLERSQNVINKIAYTNIITDLKNRYSLESDIKEKLESEYVNVAYFDIDNFRNINETFGYDFGDNFLSDISNRLVEKFSQYAEIYNIFGNEFCIVFNENIPAKQAEQITNEVFETIKDTYLIGNIYIQINVSGIIYRCSPQEFSSAGSMLLKLESIVRNIKKNGGNYCQTSLN